jgi:hypothetical protein
MACTHVFDYIGDQKGQKASARYFKCKICGCVKIKSDEGAEYLIPESMTTDGE